MAENTTFLKLIDLVQAELPAIARSVMESTSNALQSSAKHFALIDPWSKRRSRFQMEFESELRPALARMRQGEQPARPQFGSIEGLSLVDEHQALRDVGIAHVVELCAEHSRTELFQLGNFFTALKRGSTPGRDPNLLRPALFARALVNALAGADLNAEANYALVRAAAPGLAQALVPLYRQLAATLREANLSALVSARPGQERPRRRDQRDSQPGALADWHARSQAITSRPQALIRSEPQAQSLLERLYERILADPMLTPPVKAQLARLQVAVARLSQGDASLLRREDHPAWRLINAIAAYAGGFANGQDPRLANLPAISWKSKPRSWWRPKVPAASSSKPCCAWSMPSSPARPASAALPPRRRWRRWSANSSARPGCACCASSWPRRSVRRAWPARSGISCSAPGPRRWCRPWCSKAMRRRRCSSWCSWSTTWSTA